LPAVQIDRIIRSRRKTVALIVQNDGQVIVRAPLRVSARAIQEFVDEKADWVRAKQEQARKAGPPPAPRKFQNGELFWFLGRQYPLHLVEPVPGQPVLALNSGFQLDRRAVSGAGPVFTAWYREQCRVYLTQTVKTIAARHGFRYARIKITSAETRWGSCSSTGTLSFPWRLVMAPPDVIEYVVVHELVHTRVPNHGREFWAAVAAIDPDYPKKIAWLKANGRQLRI
jgi:predicted metal-dependent hydrolase